MLIGKMLLLGFSGSCSLLHLLSLCSPSITDNANCQTARLFLTTWSSKGAGPGQGGGVVWLHPVLIFFYSRINNMIKKTSNLDAAGAVSLGPGEDSGGSIPATTSSAVLDTSSKAQPSSTLPFSFGNLTVSPSNGGSPSTLPSGNSANTLGKIY